MGVRINETCYKTGRVSTRDFTVYCCEAVWYKGKNSLKTQKMHFLPVFELTLASLTAIRVEQNQCPSHQSILLTQGLICEIFAKKFRELAMDGLKFWRFPWFPANSLLCVIKRYTVYVWWHIFFFGQPCFCPVKDKNEKLETQSLAKVQGFKDLK